MLFDIGYGLTAAGYLVLVMLLVVVRKAGLAKLLLLGATSVTCLWAVAHISLLGLVSDIHQYAQLDSIRLWVWVLFLSACLQNQFSSILQLLLRPVSLMMMVLPTLTLIASVTEVINASLQYLLFTLVTVQILVVLEQVYRQSSDQRWAYKPLIIYLGSLTIFDFFTYANAAMVNSLDWSFFAARGYIYLALLPFLILAIRRIQQWGIDIFVSREVVLHSTLLMLSGAYLMVMALLGYLVNYFGGEWGTPIQIILFLVAVVMLLSLFLSHEFRTKLKVFITKNFYANQFDYRVEWLALTQVLSTDNESLPETYHCALQGWMQGIKYDQGVLVKMQGGYPVEVASVNDDSAVSFTLIHEQVQGLASYFEQKSWIIDIDEMRIKPDLYNDLALRNELIAAFPYQLIIPVFQKQTLWGMVCLQAQGPEKKALNWEIRDYLLAVTEQTANFIFQAESAKALTENAQFAAFNRMSAFVVHDLKNVLAQITLLLDNAKQHKSNPEFIDDAFETLEHTKSRMEKMLKQLMDKSVDNQNHVDAVNIAQLIDEVIDNKCRGLLPLPILHAEKDVSASIDSDKFANVMYHLINNAQQATPDSGEISIEVSNTPDFVKIDVQDSGEGMSQAFIDTKLFKPFETTKGNAGMGVGAYDAKTYIQGIGGNLSVESEVEKGSCFTLYLPRLKDSNNT